MKRKDYPPKTNAQYFRGRMVKMTGKEFSMVLGFKHPATLTHILKGRQPFSLENIVALSEMYGRPVDEVLRAAMGLKSYRGNQRRGIAMRLFT